MNSRVTQLALHVYHHISISAAQATPAAQLDLIKILHRMDQQLSDLEQPAFSFSSSITARIRELARQSSELVANFMLFRDGVAWSPQAQL